MPKFTDLPIAIGAKDNDIFAIVDPDANESRQIPLSLLRGQLSPLGYLFGAAVQNLSLPSGKVLQRVTGYSSSNPSGDTNNDPITGEITIAANTTGLIKVTFFCRFDIISPSNQDNIYNVYIRKVDQASTFDEIVGELFVTSSSVSSVVFNGAFPVQVQNGDVISMHLSSDSLSQSVNVQQTLLMQEPL